MEVIEETGEHDPVERPLFDDDDDDDHRARVDYDEDPYAEEA